MNDEIEKINQRLANLENDIENTFYIFLSNRVERKCILEMLEDAIVEHYGISKKDFKFMSFKIDRKQSRFMANSNKNIVEARKWMIVLSRFILLKTTGSLKLEYDWYFSKNEPIYRRIFSSAIDPKDDNDLKYRTDFLSISGHIKKKSVELYNKMGLEFI